MTKLWETRKAPVPLDYEQISSKSRDLEILKNEKLKSQKVWTASECLLNFSSSLRELKAKLSDENDHTLMWDKVNVLSVALKLMLG